MADHAKTGSETARANRAVMLACAAFVVSMVGMAYAAVPLYELFCQATGYGGATRRVEAAAGPILDKQVTVRFDANTADGLPWDFRPVDDEVVVHLGETMQVAYRATNHSSRPVRAQAMFNVTPHAAGAYFNKIDCFCFTEQVLQPGETADMPIVFFIDSAYVEAKELKKIDTVTLSYTFFPLDETAGAVVSPAKHVNRNT